MSIRARLDDALHLWEAGRVEGAWTQALIAAAATARKRYPRPMGDREAFNAFICDIANVILTGRTDSPGPGYIRFYTDDREDHRTLEDVFYKDLRCNLVHEGVLKEIGFSESTLEDDVYTSTLSVPTRGEGTIPDHWVLNLIAAVRAAPETAEQGSDSPGNIEPTPLA